MNNADRFADKFTDKWVFEKVANQQTDANAGGSAGSRTPDHLIKSPCNGVYMNYHLLSLIAME